MRKAKTYVMIPTAVIVEAMEHTRELFGGVEHARKPRRRKSVRRRRARKAGKAVT